MIRIQNIYYMLTYAFRALQANEFHRVATEKFQNSADLLAEIFIIGLTVQLKRGIVKEYIPKQEELSTIRGKVDLTKSFQKNSISRKRFCCSFDDFSSNHKMNGIIKSTVLLLVKAPISNTRKRKLRKLMMYFEAISPVELHTVNWNFQYDRTNQTYQLLMSICFLVYKGLLQTNDDGSTQLMDFIDNQQMARLYEKFILEFFKKHYPELTISSARIPWVLDNDFDGMLPMMQSDIYIRQEQTILIIDAKYYTHTTNRYFEKQTIHSNNLYQLFTYVKNCYYSFENTSTKVSGILLYAKTDETIQPNHEYLMHGNRIEVKTLDLNVPFQEISEQLDGIIHEHFLNVTRVE